MELYIFIAIVGLQSFHNPQVVLEKFLSILLGLIFCLIVFGLGYLLSRGSMGAGDVKLSFVMGLFLTGDHVTSAILYGCVISAIYSLVQMARKKITRKDTLPFVPFLYLGVVVRYLIW